MKIEVIGGGPSGLYFAISMKLRNPDHQIDLYERNGPDDTFGWGVVLSDETMGHLEASDPESARLMAAEYAHWDDIDVHFKGQVISSGGHGFIGIGRQKLLDVLQSRAADLGVKLHFHEEIEVADTVKTAAGLVLKQSERLPHIGRIQPLKGQCKETQPLDRVG